MHGLAGSDCSLLQERDCGGDLEDGPWGDGHLDRAVEERIGGGFEQLFAAAAGFGLLALLIGLILLAFPYFTQIADSTHSILQEAAEPLGPVIVKIVRFIFGRSRFQIETGSSGTVGLGMNPVDPSLAGDGEVFLRQVIGWGLAGILGLLAVGVLGYLMNQFIRWLLKRNTTDETKPPSSTWIIKLLSLIMTIPHGVWNRVLYLVRGFDSAAAVYAGVLCWGRRSGLPSMPSETAGEYGIRLKHQFPKLKEEIEMIIEAFNREVYGETATGGQSLSSIRSALRRMRSPRHWPARISRWFVQTPFQGLALSSRPLREDIAG